MQDRPSDPYKGIVVFMPTRNRAEIAMQSIAIMLDSSFQELHLLVSDNSTDEQESRVLQAFCRERCDPRLHYIRPPHPLSMSENLDWVIGQALARFDANHLTGLWDRIVLKPDALETLRQIALAYPDKICTFHWDHALDASDPVHLQQHPWTGKLLEVRAERLLWLAAHAREFHAPKMTNCLMPRSVLETIRARFGSYCNSITADICFGYRALSFVDSVLVYDRALMVTYGLKRSNAHSQIKGIYNQDTKDFLVTLQKQQQTLNAAAPIPEAFVPGNQTLHEYCLVKQQAGNRFPEVDMPAYLEMLARGAAELQNPEARRDMEVILAKYGQSVPPPPSPVPSGLKAKVEDARRRYGPATPTWKLLVRLGKEEAHRVYTLLPYSAPTKPFWLALARTAGMGLPPDQTFAFRTSRAALDCALRYPRRKAPDTAHLSDLFADPDKVKILPPLS